MRAFFFALLALVLLSPRAHAGDALDEIRSGGKLLWGADQEGGGPYVYPREGKPNEISGFEAELAELLAKDLGVAPSFSQGDWGKLPDLLRVKKIHVVMNGYEWSRKRASQMESSIPYYVYGLQLLARSDDSTLSGWKDLENGSKRKIGVLGGSAAHTYLAETLGDRVEAVLYDGNTDAMREVETRKIDAALEDTPIAAFYAARFPGLRRVGEPVAKGYYVLYAEKGERRLIEALNTSLARAIENGAIERIDRTYGIWNEDQAELKGIAKGARFFGIDPGSDRERSDVRPGDAAKRTTDVGGVEHRVTEKKRGFAILLEHSGTLVKAALVTALLAITSFPLALALGMLVALGRVYGPRSLRAPLAFYVEFLRGTPLLLQLYFVFFLLPEVGIRIPAMATAILGLAINYSAYESEIYRAGLQAIPVGQMEAALSLGMSRPLAIRRIIAPQAFRLVIPPVVNDFIALFKDTSLCSVVTVVELTKRYSILSMSTQATIELMSMTAILYLAMSYPLSRLAQQLERRLDRRET